MPYTLLTRGRGIIKYIIPKLQTGQDVEVLETWFNFCLFFKGHLKYSCRHVKHLTLHRCLEKTGFWRQNTQFAYLFSHKHICCLSGRPKALLRIKTHLSVHRVQACSLCVCLHFYQEAYLTQLFQGSKMNAA